MRFAGCFMRILTLTAVFLALSFSGCTTSSRVDALDVAEPSMEETSSVRPVPPADVSAVEKVSPAMPERLSATVAEPETVELAMAPDTSSPPALSLAEIESASETADQVAMIQPPRLKPRREAGLSRGVHGPKFRDAKPIRFGRVAPKHFAVHGVDVSRWQGNINWNVLRKNGANFAFIKATDGGDHLDPMFRRNWDAAEAAGVKRGAYHFFYWCRPAAHQAEWFIRHVPREANALPPVIDVEWTRSRTCTKRPSRATVLKKMNTFMNMLESHYGQRPIIYTAPDFYDDNLQGAFPNHPFWLRSVAAHPSKVYPRRNWVFWQYSGTGLSKGVGEKIDLLATLDQIKQLREMRLGLEGFNDFHDQFPFGKLN